MGLDDRGLLAHFKRDAQVAGFDGGLDTQTLLALQLIEIGVGLLQVLVGRSLDTVGLCVRFDETLVVDDREAHVGVDHRRGRRRGFGALGRGRRGTGGMENEHAHGNGKDAREEDGQCQRLTFHVVLSEHLSENLGTTEVWAQDRGHV